MTSPLSARIVLIAIFILSVWSLSVQLDPGPDAPSDEDWTAAGEWLRERAAPEDAVRFHPQWMERGETVLQAFKGRAVPTVDRSVPPDLALGLRHPRLWVVSALGRDDIPEMSFATHMDTTELDGGIRMHLYTLARDAVSYDLLGALNQAKVSRRRGPTGRYEACVLRGDRHDCRGKAWENVEIGLKHVGGAPRRCAVLHPYPDRGAVRVRWSQVPVQSTLMIRTGFTLDAARNEKGEDCRVTVRVAGEIVSQWVEPKNAWHFERHDIDTRKWAGTRVPVEIEVETDDEDFRDLCFDGYVLSR